MATSFQNARLGAIYDTNDGYRIQNYSASFSWVATAEQVLCKHRLVANITLFCIRKLADCIKAYQTAIVVSALILVCCCIHSDSNAMIILSFDANCNIRELKNIRRFIILKNELWNQYNMERLSWRNYLFWCIEFRCWRLSRGKKNNKFEKFHSIRIFSLIRFCRISVFFTYFWWWKLTSIVDVRLMLLSLNRLFNILIHVRCLRSHLRKIFRRFIAWTTFLKGNIVF